MEKTTAHITDIHLDEQFPIVRGVDARENWSLILDDMSSRQIDEVIFGGDIGTSSSNKWFFDSLNRYAGNLKVTLGNHDTYPEVKKYYGKDDSESEDQLYYGYENPFYAYFFMDSSPGAVSARQLEWLKSALHAADKKTVIFIHHPILQVRTPADRKFPLSGRTKIKELLLRHEREIAVFCGHYHMEDETRVGNITQYITPAGSYQFVKKAPELEVDAGTFGYRIIRYAGARMETQTILFDKRPLKN